MKVAFIARSTLFQWKGGDTMQVINTARHLNETGIQSDIFLTHQSIDYKKYDLLHFFNIIRPADILYHIQKSNKPFVVSPILVDYSEFDRQHRKGTTGMIFRFLSPDAIEYVKTIARWIRGTDKLMSKSYILKGQHKSILEILRRASHLLPNSQMEYDRLVQLYDTRPHYTVVPYAADNNLFIFDKDKLKDPKLIICVGQIEGRKNQLNLIRALNDTSWKLLIIGSPAANQQSYYGLCRSIASANISFIDHLPQEKLVQYYQEAVVHVLPSWFETCGLTTMEAAIMGCNVVITDKGFAREYYGEYAFYCDPASPPDILKAVEKAATSAFPTALREIIMTKYTWPEAARHTKKAYSDIIS